MNFPSGLLFALSVVCMVVFPARGITGAAVLDPADPRFDAVAAVTLAEWQLLNVPIGNATLISPDRVVLPRHVINSNFTTPGSTEGLPTSYVVRFRAHPDGTRGNPNNPGSYYHVRVARWIVPKKRTASDDMIVGVLEAPVTHIQPMAIDYRPRLVRGKLAASLLSWGPRETGEKGQLAFGGVFVDNLGAGSLSWTLGSQGLLNDSGAAIVRTDAAGRSFLIGYVTTARSGIAFRKWKSGAPLASR